MGVTWRVDMITPDVSTARERVVLRLVCELGARAIAGGIPTHLSQRQGSPHLYKNDRPSTIYRYYKNDQPSIRTKNVKR